MLYGFNNSSKDFIDTIDHDQLLVKLKKIYETDDIIKLEKEVKKVIKNKDRFTKLKASIKLDSRELIEMLVYIFPSMFNHHLIKFIKENHLKPKRR